MVVIRSQKSPDLGSGLRIIRIMLILEIINSIEPLVFSSNVVKGKYCERIRII